MTKDERLAQVKQVKLLVKTKELNTQDACKQVGIPVWSYYNTLALSKPKISNDKPIIPRKKRNKPEITVTDIPMVTSDKGKLFLLFGSPALLAEFTRNYQ